MTLLKVPVKRARIFQEYFILNGVKSKLSAALKGLFHGIFQEWLAADLCSILLNILGIFRTSACTLNISIHRQTGILFVGFEM